MSEQPELDLEFPTYDRYKIELRVGPLHDERVVRHHEAKDVEAARDLIEGIRDSYNQRDGVTWQDEEVNAEGKLYGLGKDGQVYVIAVVPALTTALS